MFDVKLVEGVLNVGEVYAQAVSRNCGAVTVFVGTTRDNFDGLPVTILL